MSDLKAMFQILTVASNYNHAVKGDVIVFALQGLRRDILAIRVEYVTIGI